MDKRLTSLKAMFLKAFYDWSSQYNEPIHIFVNNRLYKDDFLKSYETPDGLVTLNISPNSINNFKLDDNGLSFKATFGGIEKDLFLPINCIGGFCYPKENSGITKPYILPTQSMFDFQNKKINIDVYNEEKVKAANSKADVIDFSSRRKNKDKK